MVPCRRAVAVSTRPLSLAGDTPATGSFHRAPFDGVERSLARLPNSRRPYLRRMSPETRHGEGRGRAIKPLLGITRAFDQCAIDATGGSAGRCGPWPEPTS